MPRGQQAKLFRSFTKGLVTEAGFLTYPEDASTDELNTILYRGGNRSRRLGIDYEDDSTVINPLGIVTNQAVTAEHLWRSPGQNGNLNFLVVQMDNYLYFFDAGVSPLSAGRKSFSVDLNLFRTPFTTENQLKENRVAMASGKGHLFVAHPFLDPFTVSYDKNTNSIQSIRVLIMMRDYDGVPDGLPNDAEPFSLSNEHHYNLKNQGWVTPGSVSVQATVPTSPTDPTAPLPPPPPPTTDENTDGVTYDPYTGEYDRTWRWDLNLMDTR